MLVRSPLTVLTLGLLVACSSDVAESTDAEGTSVALEARETTDGSFDAEQLASVIDFVDLDHCYIGLLNERGAETPNARDPLPPGGIPTHMTIGGVPSASVVQLLFPDENPPNPEAHAVKINVPTIEHTGYNIWLTELRSDQMKVTLEQSALRGRISFHGRLYLWREGLIWPDFYIVVDSAEGIADFTRVNGTTALGNLEIALNAHSEGCGFGGICDGVVNRFLPKIKDQIHTVLVEKIQEMLRQETIQSGLVKGLETLDNMATAADPPYSIDPPSIQISGGVIRFKKSRP
jgi:hypothetical protein